MALTCNMSLNYASYSAGQTPPPMATLQVYNPNAVAVVVTGVEMTFVDSLGQTQRPCINPPLVPIGTGQTVSVPPLSSLNFGPFPLAFGTAAAASSFDMVPPGAQPPLTQGSQKPQQQFFVGARVYGSDGSVNESGRAGILVSYTVSPPLGYQGGFAQFANPNNTALLAAGVL